MHRSRRTRATESGARQSAMRRAISSAGTSRFTVRAPGSITMVSPSRTAAIGPPRAASGETWPIRMPCETPEKRPSVISATSSPRPRPCNWIVSITISGMPGPPTGPTLRTTITLPGLIVAGADRRHGLGLGLEHPRGAAELALLERLARQLEQTALRREIALQDADVVVRAARSVLPPGERSAAAPSAPASGRRRGFPPASCRSPS